MKVKYTLNTKKNFGDNGRELIPSLYDELKRYIDRALKEHDEEQLHSARLTGKVLRYNMEVFSQIFSGKFMKCLEEVKELIEVMGFIHDCDVLVPVLEKHMQKTEKQNNKMKKNRVSTNGLNLLIRSRKRKRRQLFNKMTAILRRWQQRRFRQCLIKSME